jgi:putative oxidoreductase
MSEKCDTRCPISSSLGLLVLRLVAGASLAMHGWAKLHEPMHSGFFEGVSHMGAPFESAPKVFAYASVAAELGGGIMLAVGGLTRLAAFLLLCNFAVAIWKVHLHDPYLSTGGKAMEPAAIYAAIAFALLLTGAGRISVDGMLFCRGKTNEELPPDEEKF